MCLCCIHIGVIDNGMKVVEHKGAVKTVHVHRRSCGDWWWWWWWNIGGEYDDLHCIYHSVRIIPFLMMMMMMMMRVAEENAIHFLKNTAEMSFKQHDRHMYHWQRTPPKPASPTRITTTASCIVMMMIEVGSTDWKCSAIPHLFASALNWMVCVVLMDLALMKAVEGLLCKASWDVCCSS